MTIIKPIQTIIPGIKQEDLVDLSMYVDKEDDIYTHACLGEDSLEQRTLEFCGKSAVDAESRPFRFRPTAYTKTLNELFKYYAETFKEWKGQVIVDLGAGCSTNGLQLASKAGTRAYIAVEPKNYCRLYEEILQETSTLDVGIAAMDMLTFLRSLPDRSVSVLTSGIDTYIMQNDKYATHMSKEIERVVHKDGSFVNFDSIFSPHGLYEHSVEPSFNPLKKYLVHPQEEELVSRKPTSL